MSRIVTQSIFTTETAETRSWQSYVTSGIVHVCLLMLLLWVTLPSVRQLVRPQEHVTLIAPELKPYKPKLVPPLVLHQLAVPKELLAKVIPPKRMLEPPVIKPPEQKTQPMLAKAPELRIMEPVPAHIPEAKMEAPAPPKPEVHTGVFTHEDLAKGPKKTPDLKVGGFGDPNGAPPTTTQQARLQMPKVGGFDMPNGETPEGANGRAQNGSVHAAGFGDGASNSPSGTGSRNVIRTGSFGSGDPNGIPGGTGTHGTVRTGDFGSSAVATPSQSAQAKPVQPSTTPVEILFKPRPVYTTEARQMRLEGQVSLEVVFLAAGGVKVVRVVHGLGHGLDEAAQQAALQVRFRPATRSGIPVDTNATIYISFQLA